MLHPIQLSKGNYPKLLVFGLISILFCVLSTVSSKSIWDPFCRADILYTPYVRVFHKGRSGQFLRESGPGFIDLRGLKDIYVCTNGLVMFYYTMTKGMGHIFEQGDLHWTPHHCELYNTDANSGMVPDHPKKTLLSILLIGHSTDYRRPALQMFVAPAFDKYYGDYINLTSLIMIGTGGECLIEKGVEKARLRVRNQPPKYIADIPWNDPKPPIFCKLDVQRGLGQRGLITLAKPGWAGVVGDNLFTYKARAKGFRGTELEKSGKSGDHQKLESGSATTPRYFASSLKGGIIPDSLGDFADVADEVYAALIHDRKMEFVGCHTYPDFTIQQMKLMEDRKQYYQLLKLSNDTHLVLSDSVSPFWAQPVPLPGLDISSAPTRFALYIGFDVKSGGPESYDDIKNKVATAEEALAALITAKGEADAIKAAEYNLMKEKMLFSLWPLKKAYSELYKQIGNLEDQAKAAVIYMHDNVTGCHIDIGSISTRFNEPMINPEKELPVVIAAWKENTIKMIAKQKMEFRLDPYNRQLIEEYDSNVKKYGILSPLLTKVSVYLGPMISNSETLISRIRLYRGMLIKTMTDLEKAVSQMEKTRKPYEHVTRDPFERYFADTMIEISDAVNADGSNGKACYELPSVDVACNSVKPTSQRAYQLYITRKSKGRQWLEEDSWRGRVLGLIEEIFQSACPYVDQGFGSSITKVLTGYLLAEPLGTGLKLPIIGSRLETVDHQYQAIVYNKTNSETDMTGVGEGRLRPMQPFWEQIITALEDCQNRAKPMQFWHNEEDDKPSYITYRKLFTNNNTEVHYKVDDLMMLEKADNEFVFNWAIEMNWRMFATALGICMPQYENSIPLISARFYAMYSQDFLHPLKQIWMSNRDNPVFQTILGDYYYREKAEPWTKRCMESSFVESGDRNYRPPRSLYVNAFTEMNYFLTGPLAGSPGILAVVENSL